MGVCYFRRIFFGVCYHCQFLCIFKRGSQRFLNRIIFSTCLQFKRQLWILNIVSVCFTCFMNFNFCQDSGTFKFLENSGLRSLYMYPLVSRFRQKVCLYNSSQWIVLLQFRHIILMYPVIQPLWMCGGWLEETGMKRYLFIGF